ncbi:IclR family transcriptional regulator [Natrarchaeobaculum aegyptiacum]|uniref:IclR family transcriptional regulator n=1 Tax=Natrarchaeobaculum aegyptiacum TaxID=745377 RepID=A0A2Z2I0F1_9EURY|nr:IclR family transcriptional regulator [Natrarchaeobaculum aegyptiacum]ARS91887.1 IclR family transcriptional regulator [Natrarchaeobaculum aegyptiacum]
MTKEANHPVRTTEKSLLIVEKLRELDGARIYQLEEDLEMTKGAIHNHLSTLRKHGYVVKNGNEYALSLQFLTLGGYVRSNYLIYEHGRPKANTLADDTGMLVNLATEENGQSVYLYQARGEYAVNLDTQLGHRLRLHNIGIGKAIMAYLSDERVDEILDQWGLPAETENTITDRDRLFEELETVREQEYATDLEERTEGLCCIAAPIRPDNEILGAISVSTPTSRLGDRGFDDDLIGQVKSTANQIALDIKYR